MKGDIRIYGKKVPESVIVRAVARMRDGQVFRSRDIVDVIQGMHDAKGLEHMRVADRLIQRERKAGNIKTMNERPYWEWVGK